LFFFGGGGGLDESTNRCTGLIGQRREKETKKKRDRIKLSKETVRIAKAHSDLNWERLRKRILYGGPLTGTLRCEKWEERMGE